MSMECVKAKEVALNGNPHKDLYQDCPLIEIVHFHECLRGELRSLHDNVKRLRSLLDGTKKISEEVLSLEMQVQSQFKLLHAVFQAHSTAEDETIWPALKQKALEAAAAAVKTGAGSDADGELRASLISEQDYIEDHEEEEAFFVSMEEALEAMRAARPQPSASTGLAGAAAGAGAGAAAAAGAMRAAAAALEAASAAATAHLLAHLRKEESHALPLVRSHLSPAEMEDLVGRIMGERPSELMHAILAMMRRNLPEGEWGQMAAHMRRAVDGTYFEKWLAWGGFKWPGAEEPGPTAAPPPAPGSPGGAQPAEQRWCALPEVAQLLSGGGDTQRGAEGAGAAAAGAGAAGACGCCGPGCGLCGFLGRCPGAAPLGNAELGRLLRRATAAGGAPRAAQRLRQRQWAAHQAQAAAAAAGDGGGGGGGRGRKRPRGGEGGAAAAAPPPPMPGQAAAAAGDGAGAGGYGGCAHYRRRAMVQAPCCGLFYPCRLCHDQEQGHKMDRYRIHTMKCMGCEETQPVGQYCRNKACKYSKEPLSRYYCAICKLFDDAPGKAIYHCPYCNLCRLGRGLGRDFRHCMKCNCCVALSAEPHRCLPKALEGDCPICSEPLFVSTREYKGLRCGHLLHLDCYQAYVAQGGEQLFWFRCPVCRKSMDDMTEYFSQLDAVVAAQPMPPELRGRRVRVLCLDCEAGGQEVPHHFLYHKCPRCGSYNTQLEGEDAAAAAPGGPPAAALVPPPPPAAGPTGAGPTGGAERAPRGEGRAQGGGEGGGGEGGSGSSGGGGSDGEGGVHAAPARGGQPAT